MGRSVLETCSRAPENVQRIMPVIDEAERKECFAVTIEDHNAGFHNCNVFCESTRAYIETTE
jgi:hypothetical protein